MSRPCKRTDDAHAVGIFTQSQLGGAIWILGPQDDTHFNPLDTFDAHVPFDVDNPVHLTTARIASAPL